MPPLFCGLRAPNWSLIFIERNRNRLTHGDHQVIAGLDMPQVLGIITFTVSSVPSGSLTVTVPSLGSIATTVSTTFRLVWTTLPGVFPKSR